MANTYTQIHVHAIFAVRHRIGIIRNERKDELYRYISGIIQNHKHKLLAINGMSDHLHIFFGMRPSQSLSDLMQDVKANSSRWINEKKLVKGRFEWQEGFGAFTYSKSQVAQVIRYIENQEAHHHVQTFLGEYKEFLERFDVNYDERYIFKVLE